MYQDGIGESKMTVVVSSVVGDGLTDTRSRLQRRRRLWRRRRRLVARSKATAAAEEEEGRGTDCEAV